MAITERINNIYRTAGYHLSRAIVPPQDIKDGRIRIRVIEGRITEIALNGNGADPFGIRSLLQPVIDEPDLRWSGRRESRSRSSSMPSDPIVMRSHCRL